MSSPEQVNLITNAQAFLMYKEPALSATQAVEKLQQIAADSRAVPPVTHTEYPFWQSLSNTSIAAQVFTDARTAAIPAQRIELCQKISLLKFNDEERFALLMKKNDAEIKDILFVLAPMKQFIVNMGRLMAQDNYTLKDAIERSFKENYIGHMYLITRAHTECLLSAAVKMELYWHARIGLIMGEDSFHGHPEEAYLSPNAEFHLAHQEKIYRETDKALSKLGFSIKECNALLLKYADQIALFKQKIDLMKTLLTHIENLIQQPMKFNQAKRAVLSSGFNTLGLTEVDFQELFSAKQKKIYADRYLTYVDSNPLRSNVVPLISGAVSAPQQNTFALPFAMNNTNMMVLAGSGLGTVLLVTIALCRTNRLLTAPISLVKYTSKKIMGCFVNPETAAPAQTHDAARGQYELLQQRV